jgi:hypothetical protein
MKSVFSRLLISCSITTTSFFSSYAQSLPDNILLRVVIIRHGEKPDSGFNLSCKGYNRSLALPKVFTALFGVPDYTYVPVMREGRSTNSVRMYQTIVPFAVKYGLVINSKHAQEDTSGLAASILEKKGTVLVVWDSKNIPPIARNLGIKNKELKWEAADYDSIWIINFVKTKKGKLQPGFSIAKENLDPSPKCN